MSTANPHEQDWQLSFQKRWGLVRLLPPQPWPLPPAVRILMYADGVMAFSGGPYLGFQHVYKLLKSGAYSFVQFDVQFAHRDGTDPNATISGAQKLTSLDILNKYDEIWFFGYSTTPSLTEDEIALLDQFMAAPKLGGILVTGDNGDRGKGITGQIIRAGSMRRYPSPGSYPPDWNTTLVDGPDTALVYNLSDQSDDLPQTIRYKLYELWFNGRRNTRPHPVLCGPDGPIDVLPDHQHEGEAAAPQPAAGDSKWPAKNGRQEKPDVIAWGRISDPSAGRHGEEFPVISAYDGHNVGVGRILADSSWHHWVDINLTGTNSPPSPYAGFDATVRGQMALKKIESYFLNTGVWLAPPERQRAIQSNGWLRVLWSSDLADLLEDALLFALGVPAYDALERLAPECTVHDWVVRSPLDSLDVGDFFRVEWPELRRNFKFVQFPLDRYIAGGILQKLMREFGPWNPRLKVPPTEPPDPTAVERLIKAGAQEGLNAFIGDIKRELAEMSRLVETNFKPRRVRR